MGVSNGNCRILSCSDNFYNCRTNFFSSCRSLSEHESGVDSVGRDEKCIDNSKPKLVRDVRIRFTTTSYRLYGLPKAHQNANHPIYGRHLLCRWRRRSCKMVNLLKYFLVFSLSSMQDQFTKVDYIPLKHRQTYFFVKNFTFSEKFKKNSVEWAL